MNVSEMFGPVIQGEGANQGMPCVFIRLKGCNLNCGLTEKEHSWVCDSVKVWREGTDYRNEEIIYFFKEKEIWDSIIDGTYRVILTGGEPTIKKNADDLISFIRYVDDYYPSNRVIYELETNGTINTPSAFRLFKRVDQINCSPKLISSGVDSEHRVNMNVINEIASYKNKSWFKFVISSEEDVQEAIDTFLSYDSIVKENQIILMPACDSREKLPEAQKLVWELGAKYGFRVSSRLQILCFDKLTGV